VLASQSEVALDRSETFLRNQDPKRSFARAKPSDLPFLRGIALYGLDQVGNDIGATLRLTDTCGHRALALLDALSLALSCTA
jgi:hypothetical protein